MGSTSTRAMGIRRRVGIGSILGIMALGAVALPAQAADVEREKRGACSLSSDWELSLEREHGRIEIDVEIDTRQARRAWDVRVFHAGARIMDGRRVTDGEGEIDIDRRRPDRAGRDRVRFRAVDRVNGETCSGTLRI